MKYIIPIRCYATQFDLQIHCLISQDQNPSDVRTQMETEHDKEIVKNQQEAEDKTKNLDKSHDTVSSQTDASTV